MINLVKTISSKIDDAKRRIVKVLRLGAKDVQTTLQISPFGDDSVPIEDKDLIALYAKTGQKGKAVVIGYINRNCVAGPGEKRLFSTDKSGSEKTYLYLKNDGTIEVNGNSDNFVTYKEFKAKIDQLKTLLNQHTHTGNLGAPTSPPVSPFQVDFSGTKSENVKTE